MTDTLTTARAIINEWRDARGLDRPLFWEGFLRDRIEAALRAERKAAIEEAAKVPDGVAKALLDRASVHSVVAADICRDIAAAIRQLSEEQ